MPAEVTSIQSCDSLFGATDGYLTLRVCSREHRGRVVRLASQKCTIGSGPQCTLRLRGRGIRPLHCLILRGESGTYIRRWSPDTSLNGRGFNVARLKPGDRLHVAAIEFEVLSNGRFPPSHCGQEGAELASAADGVESNAATSDRLEHELTQLQRQLDELQSEHQLATVECQRAGQESESARSATRELQQQLDSVRAVHDERGRQWESDRRQLQTELDERTRQLEQLGEEHAEHQSSTQDSQQANEAELQQLREDNQQLTQQLRDAARDNQQRDGQQELVEQLREALADLKQQFDARATQNEQLIDQLQTAQDRIGELEQALAAAGEESEQAAQLTARFEEVTLQLETMRTELETRSQHWEMQLSDRKAAVQQLRQQLEEAGKTHEQQVADRESIALRLQHLEQENKRLVAEVAELKQLPQPSISEHGPATVGAIEWNERVAGLQAELEKTREEHQQILAEWRSDRAHLEQQLAERSEELARVQEQRDTSMREAEALLHSLQREGKQLLSQLDEAKSTIRQDTELRKQLEAARKVQQADPCEVEQLRQTVRVLEQKCVEQEGELSRKTIVLQSLANSAEVPVSIGPSGIELPAGGAGIAGEDADVPGERETRDRQLSPPDRDATSGIQPSSTLALGPDFQPQQPNELTGMVDGVPLGQRPTEDRQPSLQDDRGELTSEWKQASPDIDAHDEEHVIQNYMERLLQRVGCRSPETPAAKHPAEAAPAERTADEPTSMPVEKKDADQWSTLPARPEARTGARNDGALTGHARVGESLSSHGHFQQ